MSKRISNTIRKLSSVIMVFALLLGMLTVSGNTITAKASQSPVKLYSVEGKTIYHGLNSFNVYIQIAAGSAGSKAVSVHYRNYDDTWLDADATFLTKLDSETEIWKANVSGCGLSEYAIKYVGDGITYWDNNNGNNHSFYEPLGEANVKAVCSSYQTAANYNIYAAVKNLAYTKVVKVRYTEDNWATYQDVELHYSNTLTDSSTEIWTTTLHLDSSKIDNFHFCISYEVNGQTYWDNNWGANYDRSFYSPY